MSGSSSSNNEKQADAAIAECLATIKQRDPNQPEFFQAAEEVISSIRPVLVKHPKYLKVLKAVCEPERVLQFRVSWMDDKGVMQHNRGFRVQFNSAIGPYKGGLRFHPSVNLSIIKFLGFEQIFKNALTTLAMGGGKGGSDFNPKGKSDSEVMAFCKSFMTELSKHIGPNTDVPAGDIGVGGREIGFMYGQYRRLRNEFTGVLTGKGGNWGGSLIRPEATGYGLVYLTKLAVEHAGKSLKGAKCLVSGSGNVAQYCIEKLLDFGAIPVTCSDSSGTIYEPEGFTRDQLAHIMHLKNDKRARISEYANFSKTCTYTAGGKPWTYKADLALPCATQNEINADEAKVLAGNGVYLVGEGANMPSTTPAIHVYSENKMIYLPAKAANAGGVAVSGLEMAQNSSMLMWSREVVDKKLQDIMQAIFDTCQSASKSMGDEGNYQLGANVGGFMKVADAMIDQGMVF